MNIYKVMMLSSLKSTFKTSLLYNVEGSLGICYVSDILRHLIIIVSLCSLFSISVSIFSAPSLTEDYLFAYTVY